MLERKTAFESLVLLLSLARCSLDPLCSWGRSRSAADRTFCRFFKLSVFRDFFCLKKWIFFCFWEFFCNDASGTESCGGRRTLRLESQSSFFGLSALFDFRGADTPLGFPYFDFKK